MFMQRTPSLDQMSGKAVDCLADVTPAQRCKLAESLIQTSPSTVHEGNGQNALMQFKRNRADPLFNRFHQPIRLTATGWTFKPWQLDRYRFTKIHQQFLRWSA